MNDLFAGLLGGISGLGDWAGDIDLQRDRQKAVDEELDIRRRQVEQDAENHRERRRLIIDAKNAKERASMFDDMPDGVSPRAARNYVESGMREPFRDPNINDISGDPFGALGNIADQFGQKVAERTMRMNHLMQRAEQAQGNVLDGAATLPGMTPLDRAKHYVELLGSQEIAPGVNYAGSMDPAAKGPALTALQAGQGADRDNRARQSAAAKPPAETPAEKDARAEAKAQAARELKGSGLFAKHREDKPWRDIVQRYAFDHDVSEEEAAAIIGPPVKKDKPKASLIDKL
jgi:hypothetical protein